MTTRYLFQSEVATPSGQSLRLLPSKPATIKGPDGNAVTLYAGATGATTIANPTTTDANGNLELYVDPVAFLDIETTTGGSTQSQRRYLPFPYDQTAQTYTGTEFADDKVPEQSDSIFVDGFSLVKATTGPASLRTPSLQQFRSRNNVLDIRQTGSTLEEVQNDFDARLTQGLLDCMSFDMAFRLSEGTWDTRSVDVTMTADLRYEQSPSAIIRPIQNYQHETLDGTTTVFPITIPEFDGNTENVVAMTVGQVSRLEVALTEGTDFNVVADGSGGWNFALTSAGTSGDDLAIALAGAGLTFRSTQGAGRSVFGRNGRFDLSNCGYVISRGSFSGLRVLNVDNVYWDGVVRADHGTGNWDGDPLLRRGDTPMVCLGAQRTDINAIWGFNSPDLVFYGGGSGDSGPSDDGRFFRVRSIYGEGAKNLAKIVRGTKQSRIDQIAGFNFQTGLLNGLTNGLPAGGSLSVGAIMGRKFGRRLIDWRETDAGLHVDYASAIDFGFGTDGVTAASDASVAFFNDAENAIIGNLDVGLQDWSAPPGRPAVQFANGTNKNIRIEGGTIRDLDQGVIESGTGTTARGNFFGANMENVTTELTLKTPTSVRYDYLSWDGTTQVRKSTDVDEPVSEAPSISFPGETTVTVGALSADSAFSGQRRFGMFDFDLYFEATITHTEGTGRQLRIALPSGVTPSFTQNSITVATARMTNFDVPDGADGAAAGQEFAGFFGEIPNGQSYVRFYYRKQDGTVSIVTTDQIPTGSNIRIAASGRVPVE